MIYFYKTLGVEYKNDEQWNIDESNVSRENSECIKEISRILSMPRNERMSEASFHFPSNCLFPPLNKIPNTRKVIAAEATAFVSKDLEFHDILIYSEDLYTSRMVAPVFISPAWTLIPTFIAILHRCPSLSLKRT